jgi:aromatic ring hydroxylase
MLGRKVENPVDDPIIRMSMNAVPATYEFVHRPEYEDIMTARSHLTGNKINRFTDIHQGTDDLVVKQKAAPVHETPCGNRGHGCLCAGGGHVPHLCP